eukprot:g4807.t1
MEREFFSSRKRRSFLSEKSWMPIANQNKANTRSLPFGSRFKSLCQRLMRYVYHPWIFISLLIVFLLTITLPRKSEIMESSTQCVKRRIPSDSHGLPIYSAMPIQAEDQLTLMLNSFHRQDLLLRSVQHYATCSSIVRQIRVIWCEEGDPPEEVDYLKGGVEVVYDIMNGTSLNNRFIPVKELQTEVVMSIDDDIYMPCSDLHRAFKAWTMSKRSLVGFFPRAHKLDQNCKFEYFLGTKTFLEGKFSMLLTKAALFHRDYLEIFSNHMPQGIRDYVNSKHNCEDIAMQLLIANSTTTPSIFVNSPWITDSGKGPFKVQGISSDNNHQQYRTWCLNELVEMFDGVPLPLKPLNSNGESLLWIRLSPLISFLLNLVS